jgi:hypothetical protein
MFLCRRIRRFGFLLAVAIRSQLVRSKTGKREFSDACRDNDDISVRDVIRVNGCAPSSTMNLGRSYRRMDCGDRHCSSRLRRK